MITSGCENISIRPADASDLGATNSTSAGFHMRWELCDGFRAPGNFPAVLSELQKIILKQKKCRSFLLENNSAHPASSQTLTSREFCLNRKYEIFEALCFQMRSVGLHPRLLFKQKIMSGERRSVSRREFRALGIFSAIRNYVSV